MVVLNATINGLVVLKTYNQSDIEQLSRYSVKIRHSDKCVKCRFFVVLCDGPAVLGMPDIELLGVIRVICEAIDNETNDKKLDVQTRHQADSQNCSTNRDPQAKPYGDNVSRDKTSKPNYLNSSTNKTDISDYFHSRDNKEAEKRSETISKRKHNDFNDLFSGIECFEVTFSLQVR